MFVIISPILAIVVKISTQTKIRDDNIYLSSFKANVRRVFHQPPKNNFITGQEITVKTPSSLSMCRAQVTKNTRYLMGGSIKRNTIYLTSCGLVQPWKNVPKHVRRALRKHSMSCKCLVSGCNSDHCVRFQGAPPQTNNCKNYANFITKCFEQNGICHEKKGVCQWEHNSLDRVQKCVGRATTNPEKTSKSKNALTTKQR